MKTQHQKYFITQINLILVILLLNHNIFRAQTEVVVGPCPCPVHCTQIWMTMNLNTDRFRNGDLIPEAKTPQEWIAANNNKQPAWCYYENNPANGDVYGKLYNWYAINDERGLAPFGWRIPNSGDWALLDTIFGGKTIAGNSFKSFHGWFKDGGGDHTSVLNALPGGYRLSSGTFKSLGEDGAWWSSTEEAYIDIFNKYIPTDRAYRYQATYRYSLVSYEKIPKNYGFSVRCLRDN